MENYKGNHGYSTYLESDVKRAFDIAICTILLFPAMVILGLLCLVILIFEGRPVFFTHYRIGRNGKKFCLTKLRTLKADVNPYEPIQTCNKYPRSIHRTG